MSESDDSIVEVESYGKKIDIGKTDTFKKLTSHQTKFFIDCIEEKTAIWSMKDKLYFDNSAKSKFHISIEEKCAFLKKNRGASSKRIWTSLLTAYNAERKRISNARSGSGSDAIVKKFPFSEQMNFLEANKTAKKPEFCYSTDNSICETPKMTRKRLEKEDDSGDEEEMQIKQEIQSLISTVKSNIGNVGKVESSNEACSEICTVIHENLSKLGAADQVKLKFSIMQLCENFTKQATTPNADFFGVNDFTLL